jgi:aryl-alcohol dehydrogenase-like predicted oxidoreductase
MAEEIVGRFVRGRRDQVVIGSKAAASTSRHPLAGGNSRLALIRSVEESLKRLATDYLDVLWLHFWDGTTPTEEILRALNDLVSSGKVAYIGFSDSPAWIVSRAATLAELRAWAPIVALQIEYSIAARTAERELIPMAHAMGIGLVCWGPFAAGTLVGSNESRMRRKGPLPPLLEAAANAVAATAARLETSNAAVALRWLRNSSGQPVVPIVGARTVEQMRQIIKADEAVIDPADLATLDEVAMPALGFPHDLINSSYLRRFSLGDPAMFNEWPPRR